MKKPLRNKLLLIVAFFISVFTMPALMTAQEQELPVLKDVGVFAVIGHDEKTGLYSYNYSITNPASNTGQISMIDVDIIKPVNSMKLSSEGLVVMLGISRSGKKITQSFDEYMDKNKTLMKKEIIPVGVYPPSGWSAGISVLGYIGWGSRSEEFRIMPDRKLEGYKIMSYGFPSIRNIAVHPKWILMVDNVSEEDVETARRIEKEIAFYGKTLGPTAPPEVLKPVEFISNLIKMKEEAYTLGWITDKGIEISLDQKLENIKKKLEQGNTGAAKNILNAFINEVEAQGCKTYDVECPKGKHLKPEAYALLKYNAEYLVENIK